MDRGCELAFDRGLDRAKLSYSANKSRPGSAKTGEVTVDELDLVCEHVPTDPGQAILIIAADPDYQASHAFRLDDSDSPTTPTKRFFVACITARAEVHGKADDPRRTRYTISPNSNVVHAPAG
jgi:hypothetical protein